MRSWHDFCYNIIVEEVGKAKKVTKVKKEKKKVEKEK